jgi:hypothetical protein
MTLFSLALWYFKKMNSLSLTCISESTTSADPDPDLFFFFFLAGYGIFPVQDPVINNYLSMAQ